MSESKTEVKDWEDMSIGRKVLFLLRRFLIGFVLAWGGLISLYLLARYLLLKGK
jgi:hypothetical protein